MSKSNDTFRELMSNELDAVSGGFTSNEHGTIGGRRSPNGKTDVIKVMGNTKWGDVELQ